MDNFFKKAEENLQDKIDAFEKQIPFVIDEKNQRGLEVVVKAILLVTQLKEHVSKENQEKE